MVVIFICNWAKYYMLGIDLLQDLMKVHLDFEFLQSLCCIWFWWEWLWTMSFWLLGSSLPIKYINLQRNTHFELEPLVRT